METSGEVYMLHRNRPFLIMSQGMRVEPAGQVVVQIAMRLRLGTLRNSWALCETHASSWLSQSTSSPKRLRNTKIACACQDKLLCC